MKISIKPLTQSPKAKTLVLAVFQNQDPRKHPFYKNLPLSLKQTISAYVRTKEFMGRPDETKVIPYGTQAQTLLLVGKGEFKNWSARTARVTLRQIIAIGKLHRLKELALVFEDFGTKGLSAQAQAELMAESFELAAYEYTAYKTPPPSGWPKIQQAVVFIQKPGLKLTKSFEAGKLIGQSVNAARDLANTPGGDMTPRVLAAAATKAAKEFGFKCSVLKNQQLRKLKMGGILGVARGSDESPTFSVLEYAPKGHAKDQPLVFIGKGITFDSGGLNVKPDTAMYEMHMDMSGAASVIAAISAIARLKIAARVIGLVPAAENMSAGSAYRPSDQLRSMSGKTIEVKHTDAEGRIILADALTYAKRFKPKAVIDVATLTGAAVVALGQRAAAILTPDEFFGRKIHALAESSGDYAWPLPLWPEYETEVKGIFGDVANIGNTRFGGAITGAAFLWQFAKDFKYWAHVDIAPTMTSIEGMHLAKGATGAGTRLLIALARQPK
ncbi:leucyl aminopeptidase [Candidatus Parcubacteria bacterium]|jgi:leucyl aminopeptidase|nr:MAG: leucyl aminopeptidase [Candidatus Parcubacteria bacterium]